MNGAAYFDREADIVWIPTGPSGTFTRATTVEHPWGLVDHGDDGTALGIEIWNASCHIPSAILKALPEPETP